jgi:hypothetical protein
MTREQIRGDKTQGRTDAPNIAAIQSAIKLAYDIVEHSLNPFTNHSDLFAAVSGR